MKWKVLSVFALGVACLTTAAIEITAQKAGPESLSIARQGYLFAGGKYSTVNERRVMTGQLYAEFQIPTRQTHPWPIVMVHGGSQSGTNFTGTPDGREGWAQFFLREGYAVYVVDQGRATLTSVHPGHQTGQEAEVVSGLREGARVVLHPPDTLTDGARVSPTVAP